VTLIAAVAVLGLGIWVRTRAPAPGRSGQGTFGQINLLGAGGAPSPTSTPSPSAASRLPDRRAADQLRAHLQTLFAQAAAAPADAGRAPAQPSSAGAAVTAAPKPGSPLPGAAARGVNQADAALGKQVRNAVRSQFLAMAGGCYDELLARQPGTRGLIDLNVAVAGDPSLGGVVETVKVLPDATLNDSAFVTCMTESMMSLQFEASASGQYHFDFDYPFNLAPDEPDAGPAAPH
jgi:hypothetical protein